MLSGYYRSLVVVRSFCSHEVAPNSNMIQHPKKPIKRHITFPKGDLVTVMFSGHYVIWGHLVAPNSNMMGATNSAP